MEYELNLQYLTHKILPMFRQLSFTVGMVLVTMLLCCKKDEPCTTCPPTGGRHIMLDTLSVESIEILLKVWTADTGAGSAITVLRDSAAIFTGHLNRSDTTLIDSGLFPAKTYTYRAYTLRGTTQADSSALLVVRTMDTTSHSFQFFRDTLGDGSSSVLNDVAIINDTLAYAVGEIYLQIGR